MFQKLEYIRVGSYTKKLNDFPTLKKQLWEKLRDTKFEDTIAKQDLQEIKNKLGEILYEQDVYTNPLEKAVFLHCNIARLQPFIDGNKRTSRMIESVVMMNADIIPVYSAKDADILNYRKGLIRFYETGDYTKYSDYFLNRQLERIKEIDI